MICPPTTWPEEVCSHTEITTRVAHNLYSSPPPGPRRAKAPGGREPAAFEPRSSLGPAPFMMSDSDPYVCCYSHLG